MSCVQKVHYCEVWILPLDLYWICSDYRIQIIKKFPGKDSDNKQYPPLKTLRIPLKYFESEEEVNEQHQFESEEDIV